METQLQIQPIDLPAQAYRHLMHTLIALLPPPTEDTPEATLTRNRAAIARIAALAPVNANEAELAAQCISARAQAEDLLRLIRLHDNDINLVIRLNAQYAAMIRASLSAHNRLLREQQQRRKRETSNSNADQDEWTRHIAAQSMLSAHQSTPSLPTVSETDNKSHLQKTETPKRHPQPEPRTLAQINAHIDAAMRAAAANRQLSGLPRSNTATATTIRLPPAAPGLAPGSTRDYAAGGRASEGKTHGATDLDRVLSEIRQHLDARVSAQLHPSAANTLRHR